MADVPDGGKALVFISCGQVREEEIELGRALARMVDEIDGLSAYFAQNQTSFEGVSKNIFAAINRCVAFVAVMHYRGDVTFPGSQRPQRRGSVWVEQEIAIASFLQQVAARDIQPIIYIERGIEREGLRDKILLNVVEFVSGDDVLADFAEHRVPNLRELARTSRSVRQAEPNLQSPLGQVQFPPVSLEPQSINPDFIVGVHVTPWSFGDSAQPFDGARIVEISRIVQDAEPPEAERLAPKTERLGVRFASPDPKERRTEGGPKQPARQVFVWRDGRVTLRFEQDDGSPFVQIIAALHEAYVLSKAVFAMMGLVPRAHFRLRAQLHAGRERFKPIVSSGVDEAFKVDFETQPFANAVMDAVGSMLNSSGEAYDRDELFTQIVRSSEDASLPR